MTEKLNFEQKLNKLQTIADDLKKSDLPLETVTKLYAEAQILVEEMRLELDKAELMIQDMENNAISIEKNIEA